MQTKQGHCPRRLTSGWERRILFQGTTGSSIENTNTNTMETTWTWVSEVNLRDGDNSETAETNQTTVKKNKDLENICGTNVQQLETEQKPAERQNMIDQKDSRTAGGQESGSDPSKNSSERERSRIQKENAPAAWRHDRRQAETIQTLWWFQRKSSPAGQTTRLWGRIRRETLRRQSSATKEEDLLQQVQNITDKEQKIQTRRRQLLQQNWRIFVDDWGRTEGNVSLDYPRQSFKDGGKEQRWKKKKRNSCFIKMVQRLQFAMKKKTGRFSLDKSSFLFVV